MMSRLLRGWLLASMLGSGLPCVMVAPLWADQTLVSAKVASAPKVDGSADDPVWQVAKGIVTRDAVAELDIALKSVHTDQEIFFLVSFTDANESRTHKSWVWDPQSESYRVGGDREDVFVLKWNMEDKPVDLSVHGDKPYRSDIWFWKACRTDPAGYADDKIDTLAMANSKDALQIQSRSGHSLFLTRDGDAGAPPYETSMPLDYKGDRLPRFVAQRPEGSRGDIQAKGTWAGGRWTVEFGRALDTKHPDDRQMVSGGSYRFGVSRYEIAGRKPDHESEQPLYGCGDTSEPLVLRVEK